MTQHNGIIELTEEHISTARSREDCSEVICPIDVAMESAGYPDSIACPPSIDYRDPITGRIIRRRITEGMEEFMKAYDEGYKVNPFSFDLNSLEEI